ncbi:ABC transporter permease [Rhodobacteraceae bacterium D3-12]|nr:ABC transporter permease [Rhodobacteraceae bacterium D3-12]
MDFATLLQVLDSTIRLATPLLLACLAGLYSERAGVFDIGLEGKMLMAAFFSAAVAYHYSANPLFTYETTVCDPSGGNCQTSLVGYHSPLSPVWLGLIAGILSSMLLSAIHGLASITFRGNQLISGVAINFLASGITVLIAQDWFKQGGRTPSLTEGARFEPITLPLADKLNDIPVLGPIYSELVSGHTILVYIAFAAVPLTWWILFRPALACGFAPSVKTPSRLIPPVFPSSAFGSPPLPSLVSSAESRVLTSQPPCRLVSFAK